MAAFATGIFSRASAAAEALAGSSPASSPIPAASNSATSTSTTSSTISANDFLTLLVTEMQNQDPTANTDPNEYINQLVNVNSLEQLIDINQNLSYGARHLEFERQAGCVPRSGCPRRSSPNAGQSSSPVTASCRTVFQREPDRRPATLMRWPPRSKLRPVISLYRNPFPLRGLSLKHWMVSLTQHPR